MSKPKRVFSGIQPSGNLHLGNYLGAIRRWVEGQGEKENFICVVDLHAITVWQDPEDLRRQTRELAAHLLAAGIDPRRTTLFVQSHVRAHAEGSWLLSCVTPLGWLQRMTQFKDKAQKQESVMTGLLTYPVLQAADIILYDADEVPVGEDQKQHVELARDVAQRFNHLYGETFVVPEPRIAEVGARIMGFDDPTAKMSKSATARGHAVRMTDGDDEIRHTLRRAVTDSDPDRAIVFSDAPEKAGVNNLLTIYQLLTGKSRGEVEADFADARGYGDLKKAVGEVVVEYVRPIRARFNELMADADELDRTLAIGAERAREIAERKVVEVKEKMGFSVPAALR
ncbi:MAG TPA: tryptophan--tRNA ligase [Thermoanaerobaculia bacterium]|jgi:tryptophanyl-tRNA synthetase